MSDIVNASVGGSLLMPKIAKTSHSPKEFYKSSVVRMYLALPKCEEKQARRFFADSDIQVFGDECIVITAKLIESEIEKRINDGGFTLLSKIRFL